MITLALAKGRLAEDTCSLLAACGIDTSVITAPGRQLVRKTPDGKFGFIMVKPTDVPVYVHAGVADAGVVGKDTLMEANLPLFEMLDLGFCRCRMSVAGFPDAEPNGPGKLRVATKYPNIARSWFSQKGIGIDITVLSGSVELGPLVGLSDVIVDLVETGSTLKANGLAVLEDIFHISARLVVNQASLKVKADEINPWLAAMAAALEAQS